MWEKWLRYRNAQKLKDERYRFLFDTPPLDEVVVFDTETTGLNPKKDEILSIGAVIVKENKILTSHKFELFVKPSREINETSIKIHQIGKTQPCKVSFRKVCGLFHAVYRALRFIGFCQPLSVKNIVNLSHGNHGKSGFF